MARELDIVVFGATGYVGRLVARHLADHAPTDVRIGLAGRSADRLAAVRSDLGSRGRRLAVDGRRRARSRLDGRPCRRRPGWWPPLSAPTSNTGSRWSRPVPAPARTTPTSPARSCSPGPASTASTTSRRPAAPGSCTRAASTRSPPTSASCCCTSGPGADGAGRLEDTTLLVVSMKGGFSGGSIDSVRAQVDAVRADPALSRILADPYALSPDRDAEPGDGAAHGAAYARRVRSGHHARAPGSGCRSVDGTVRDGPLQHPGRTAQQRAGRVGVRPAVSLSRGDERRELRRRAGLCGGVGGGMWLGDVGDAVPAHAGAARPGACPPLGQVRVKRSRREGHFRVEIRTRTSTGARYLAVVAAAGDPGYAATSVMLGQSALCLALDRDRLPTAAGVLTPASALGLPLADRLRAAGFEITVQRVDRPD